MRRCGTVRASPRTQQKVSALNQAVHTDITTSIAQDNNGALKNKFDADKVQKEIDLQVKVSQEFMQNVREIRQHLNSEELKLRDKAKNALAKGKQEEAAELIQRADDLQKTKLIVNMIAGGLLAPTDALAGIGAYTLAPAVSYGIGQYFKEQGTEGSPAHLIAHALLGAATAAAGGNDALTAALAAGGTEALIPALSSLLYGKSPSELTPDQKNILSNIAGLTGAAVGTAGNGKTDILSGWLVAQNAVENNLLFLLAKTKDGKDVLVNLDPKKRNRKLEEELDEASKEALKQYDEAADYLKGSSIAQGEIQKTIDDEKGVIINVPKKEDGSIDKEYRTDAWPRIKVMGGLGDNGKYYSPDIADIHNYNISPVPKLLGGEGLEFGGQVNWNPYYGILAGTGGISPSVLLTHEFDHILNFSMLAYTDWSMPLYKNGEELRAMRTEWLVTGELNLINSSRGRPLGGFRFKYFIGADGVESKIVDSSTSIPKP